MYQLIGIVLYIILGIITYGISMEVTRGKHYVNLWKDFTDLQLIAVLCGFLWPIVLIVVVFQVFLAILLNIGKTIGFWISF